MEFNISAKKYKFVVLIDQSPNILHLSNLSLFNFKNYESSTLAFCPSINCFLGDNGSGKTNLLDAIYHLSIGKSAFNSVDSQNIKHQEDFYIIQGDFELESQTQSIICSARIGQKKILKINKMQYEKLSEHVGKFPLVLIAPNDTEIIHDGSEFRRSFFDGFMSQLDQHYLQSLIRYNHFLQQRNSLLKQFAEKNYFDKDLLESYDSPILKFGFQIGQERKKFIEIYEPVFQKHYQNLSDFHEEVELVYESQFLDEHYEKKYRGALQKDMILQRTTQGIHKDDFSFTIKKYPIKKFGSQGQQKSYLIALKLAQFEIIKLNKGISPILLLDDIFDKLDEKRMSKLIEMVAKGNFGQIFITDARPERTYQIFEKMDIEVNFFQIKEGTVEELQVK